MLISEVCARTGLTRKAVRYYVDKGLLSPSAHENGYRDFSADDMCRLERIAVLRRLGLGLSDISAALADESALGSICARRERELDGERRRLDALRRLAASADYAAAQGELDALEAGLSIAERLKAAFPGGYGRFLGLHFARFLRAPLKTAGQRAAYGEVIAWLDGAPELPGELADWLEQGLALPDDAALERLELADSAAIDAPEQYMADNADMIRRYMAFLDSDEYRASPAHTLRQALTDFCRQSGYWEVFIPAMRRLSPAYDEYQRRLARANELFLRRYPEAAQLLAPGQDGGG